MVSGRKQAHQAAWRKASSRTAGGACLRPPRRTPAGLAKLAAMTRIRAIKEAGGQASPRDVIAAILAEALPADDERRTFAVLNAAYFALALTDPALAVAPLVKNTALMTAALWRQELWPAKACCSRSVKPVVVTGRAS